MGVYTRSRRPDTSLFVEVVGVGPEPMVLLPGLGGTTRYWLDRTRALESCFRLVRVDLLGFGRSPKPNLRYDLNTHLNAITQALAPFPSMWMVGHSLGALLAAAFAERHPERVRGLVLIGTPVFRSREQAFAHLRSGPVRGGWLMTHWLMTVMTCVLTRRVLGPILPYLRRDMPIEVVEDLLLHTWRSSTSSLYEVVYGVDLPALMSRLPAALPVLFVHGEDDPVAPIAPVIDLVAMQPHWTLQRLHGIDHHPVIRAPDRVQQHIMRFVHQNP